jgi:hypothetical protein
MQILTYTLRRMPSCACDWTRSYSGTTRRPLLAAILIILRANQALAASAAALPSVYAALYGMILTTTATQLVYPTLHDFRENIAFWNVSRICPFVLLVRATCRLIPVYGMDSDRVKPKYSENNPSLCHFPTTNIFCAERSAANLLSHARPFTRC